MKKLSVLPEFFLQRKKIIAVVLLLAAGVFIFKPFGIFKGSEAVKGLKTEQVKVGALSTTISVSGMVEAENLASMSFLSAGRVAWVGFKEGDKVTSGQIIASLDNTEAQTAVSKAEAALKSAQSALDKVYDDLNLAHGTNYSDETQTQKTTREQAEMARDGAYQSLQGAQKALQWNSIVAPFDGVISEIKGIAVGENITPTSGSSVTVVGGGKLKFVANVDETEFGQLKLGQTGTIVLDAFPDEKFTGTITKFGVSAVKLATGGSVVPVEVSLPDDSRLKNGLNGEVEFTITGKQDVLTLPRSVVKKDDAGQYVYLQVGGSPLRQTVATGESLGSQVEITSGLKENDIVIISDVKK